MNTWSDTMDEGAHTSTHRRMDDAIEVASRLAGTDAIGAIHVAIVERPTYDELWHYRQIAASYGLTLTMTADSIILRPHPVDPETAERTPALGLASLLPDLSHAAVHRARSGMRWLHDHAASWNAGFQGLSEGTR